MDEKILVDKENMYKVLESFPAMIRDAMDLGSGLPVKGPIRDIVITGMGGSAYSGDVLKCFLKDAHFPVSVNKGYTLPKFVDELTLVFAISYSGNTEETISAYREAVKKHAKVVAVSSGGKIEELCKFNGTPFVKVPAGIQPRLSTPYLFIPMLNVLADLKMIKSQKEDLGKTMNLVKAESLKDKAKQLALRLSGKVPIIYCSDELFCIGEKWKTDINENAKTPAFYNVFPECNHNEINAYINLVGKYHVIMIQDLGDHPQVKKRFKIIKKLIMAKGVDVTEVGITGESLLMRLLYGIFMGVWVSYYLALEYKTDPTPVDIIEDLKRELAKP